MRTSILVAALLVLGGIAPDSAPAAQLASIGGPAADPHGARTTLAPYQSGWDGRQIRARLWVDGDRDYFRSGDRLRVRFSTSEDAYVALIHIDTDGRLDFLFPYRPWDTDYVRGGRVNSLSRSYQAGLPVRGRPGIGYLYLVASPVPLDYSYFSRGRGGPWDWSYAGRSVSGDPFWALEQITRLLVPDYVPYAADYFSYYVDGRHRYPYYACNDFYAGTRGGWGWSSSFGSCSRLDLFLRQHPYYYDSRMYRGDRRAYITRTYGPPRAEHRFKESATSAPGRAQEQIRLRDPRPAQGTQQGGATQSRGVTGSTPGQSGESRARPTPQNSPAQARPQSSPAQGRAQPQPSQERQRPTLERRTPSRETGASGSSAGGSGGSSTRAAPSGNGGSAPRSASPRSGTREERPTPAPARATQQGNQQQGSEAARSSSGSGRSGGNEQVRTRRGGGGD